MQYHDLSSFFLHLQFGFGSWCRELAVSWGTQSDMINEQLMPRFVCMPGVTAAYLYSCAQTNVVSFE